ncbi:MAG: PaaI family thioesterase [Gammaproteobacteria bacterium]
MHLRSLIWKSRYLNDRQRIEWYPTFWLMRLKVLELTPDWKKIRIRLPQTWLSTNVGGSLFGGFQACLADSIAPMACQKVFPGYSIWTRTLHLDFQQAGMTDLELRFEISAEQEEKIRGELKSKGRSTPDFVYGYYQGDGSLCTLIKTKVAIRPKVYKKHHVYKKLGIRLLK